LSTNIRRILLPLAALVMLLAVWQAAAVLFDVPSYLLPAPTAILAAGYAIRGAIVIHTLVTLETILAGFAVSVIVAIPLGIAVSINRIVSEALYPLLIFTHAIPIIAVAPIIVVVAGTDLPARLLIVLLIAFFPIMVATITGILDTPADMVELARATGASFADELTTVRLPYAMPFIFGGLKVGITASVIGAVVGEFVTAQRGLGYLVIQATTMFNIPMAMAAVVILAIMSVVLYQLVTVAQRVLVPWSIKAESLA
jgi:NitT/TauT family transport system permease protein